MGMSNADQNEAGWDRVVICASVAALLAVGITLLAVKQFGAQHHDAEIAARNEAMLTLMIQTQQQKIAELTQAIASTATRPAATQPANLKLINLTGQAQPNAHGQVVIDSAAARWYFFAQGLAALPADKGYEIWFIDGGRKIAGGTFGVLPDGASMLSGDLPHLNAAGFSLVITDEASGGTLSPKGTVQLAGSK